MALASTDPAAGVGILAALAAGVVSFLSPCVLPLVPGYLSAVTGVSASELDDAGWRRVLGPSLLFVASFSAIFILLGLTATGIGSALQDHKELLTKISGALIVLMGVLFVSSLFITRLNREWHVDALLERAGRGGPIVAGAAFAIAWTPCIGPTLGAILGASSLSGSAAHGAFLLEVCSAVLAIPFLLTAVAYGQLSANFNEFDRHYEAIVDVRGSILIAMGILIWTGELSQLNIQVINWMEASVLDFYNNVSPSVLRRSDGLQIFADGLDDLEAVVLHVARADDAEAPGPDCPVRHHRQSPDRVRPQPPDLERVHPNLRRREGAGGVVLVVRLRDRRQGFGLGR